MNDQDAPTSPTKGRRSKREGLPKRTAAEVSRDHAAKMREGGGKAITFWLSGEDHRRMMRLTVHRMVSRSDLLRDLIREAPLPRA